MWTAQLHADDPGVSEVRGRALVLATGAEPRSFPVTDEHGSAPPVELVRRQRLCRSTYLSFEVERQGLVTALFNLGHGAGAGPGGACESPWHGPVWRHQRGQAAGGWRSGQLTYWCASFLHKVLLWLAQQPPALQHAALSHAGRMSCLLSVCAVAGVLVLENLHALGVPEVRLMTRGGDGARLAEWDGQECAPRLYCPPR